MGRSIDGCTAALLAAGLLLSAPAVAQVATPLPAPAPPTARPLPSPPPATTLPAPIPPAARPQPVPPRPVYFAGTVRCDSDRNRSRTCRARNTRDRVEIVQVHGGSCVRNRSYFHDANSITVTDGCRATFAYGYGNVRPKASGGPNALPWLLAGAGATAGMIAIINSGNDAAAPPPPPGVPPQPMPEAVPQAPFPALPPARIEANTQFLTADQQRSMQVCLLEASRQTGISGGTAVRFDAMESIEQGQGGWRFRFRATTTHPDRQRQFSVFCRATPTQVVEFTVTPVAMAQAAP